MENLSNIEMPDTTDHKKNLHGLKIRLYRRPITIQDTPQNGPGDYMIWGYYDWASLSWGHFSLSEFFNGVILHKNEDTIHYEEQYICAYSEEQNESFIKSEKLLLIVSEIKLDDNKILTSDIDDLQNPLHRTKQQINECLQKTFINNTDVEYQILYSLGYSDIVILFKSSSYEPIYNALIDIKDSDIPIKSIYSIHGINKDKLEYWEDQQCKKASIFVSLKPRFSQKELKEKLLDIIKCENEDIQLYLLFGKYDVEVVIENFNSITDVAQLFYRNFHENAIFSPQHIFFQENINYTRTRWFYPPMERYQKEFNSIIDTGDNDFDLQSNTIFEVNEKSNTKSTFEILYAAYQFIESAINDHASQKPSSPLLGLKEILKYFWQIENNEIVSPLLANEITDILSNLLEIVICDMGNEINDVEESFKSGLFNQLQSKKPFQEDSFELAIHLIAELLQEWAQATRMIYEAPIYNIQFINSSNKIYICYYTIVELIEQSIINNFIDLEHGHPKPNYFTMIHHADKIKSQLLFPEANTKKQLIPIRLTRNFFFSPTTSIPYIIHEMGHYISPNIYKRNSSFVLTIFDDISQEIFHRTVIGYRNNYIYDMIYNLWKDQSILIQEKMNERLSKEFNNVYMDAKTIFNMHEGNFERFCIQLKNGVREIFSFINNDVSIASRSFSELTEEYFKKNKRFIDKKQKIENLAHWLYELIIVGDDVSDIHKLINLELSKLINSKELTSSLNQLIIAYNSKKDKIYKLAEDLASIIMDGISEEPSLITTILNTIESQEERKNVAYYFANIRIHENSTRNVEAVRNRIYSFIIQNSFTWKIDFHYDLFIETTADLLMIYTLDISIDDYKKIIENANQIQNTQNDIDSTYQAQLTRQYVITEYWEQLTNNLLSSNDKIDAIDLEQKSFIKGINITHLVDYLDEVAIKMQNLIKQKDLLELKSNYNLLTESKKNGGTITAEIKFVENYYLKRLSLFFNKEKSEKNN